MKSGTTLLSNYLKQNPKIKINDGDSHLFLNENSNNTVSKKINSIYSSNSYNIDKSASYSLLLKDYGRILSHNNNAKFIWILREPIKRAFSNYVHAINRGLESRTFIQCFRDDLKTKNTNCTTNYFHRSKYENQIKNLLNHVHEDKILFIVFEDFIKDPKTTLNNIYKFIGLKKYTHSLNLDEKKKNTTFTSRFHSFYPIIKFLFGRRIVLLLNSKLHFNNRLKININKDDKIKLKKYYFRDKEFLKNQLKLDIDKWN